MLVDHVRDAEEDGSGGHDERADHGVNEADDEDQEEGGVDLNRAEEMERARGVAGRGQGWMEPVDDSTVSHYGDNITHLLG